MRILVINPNASIEMSDVIREQLHAVARPDVQVDVVNPPGAPPAIESALDEAACVPPMLTMVRSARDQGYDAVVIPTGREGFDRAASTAGVEVVLVHANCIRWDLTQTLANLRADARTAAIPIVVYGAEETRAAIARLLTRSKPALFIAESNTSSDFHRQFTPFVRATKSPPLSVRERTIGAES